jgi:hypothetical protein
MGAPSAIRMASLILWLSEKSCSRKSTDGNAMARFNRASVLPRSAVPRARGAEAGRHALEGRRNVLREGFSDCASRFDRP